MKWFVSFALSFFAFATVSLAQDSNDGTFKPPHLTAGNLCTLQAVVFSNVEFTTLAAAQTNCIALENQTGLQGACTVIVKQGGIFGARPNADIFVAQFIKNFQASDSNIATLLGDLNAFLQNTNALANAGRIGTTELGASATVTPLTVQFQTVGENCQ